MRRGKPDWQKKIAEERIEILFREAEWVFSRFPMLSDRYVYLARKLAMKMNLKIPASLKRRYCHKCYAYLVPGANCKVRTNPKTKCVEWNCSCGHVNRIGYGKTK